MSVEHHRTHTGFIQTLSFAQDIVTKYSPLWSYCTMFITVFQDFPEQREVCLLFPSMQSAPVPLPSPPLPPNLQSHQTAFFRALSPPELQSFHWPAHTRTQLHCEPASPVIQRLLLMARQRLLSPGNAAAMRTISPEHTEEFGHT